MDKLQNLIAKIQKETGLSFSFYLQGNLIFGDGHGENYPLKLKETYGFLSFCSPPAKETLILLKILLEKEINDFLESSSLSKDLKSFILGDAPQTISMEDFKKTLPKGKLFLIESKNIEENRTLLQEAFQDEPYYLWVIEGRLLLFLNEAKEEEISQSIYASILENTMEEPMVAYLNNPITFDELPQGYHRLKMVLLTGKTYYKEDKVYEDNHLLLEMFLYSLDPKDKKSLIRPYHSLLSSLQNEEKTLIFRYVKNHMALQKTARDLHLHRNTLTYRLHKLEKDFNLDLKDMSHVILLYMMILFQNDR